MHAYIHTIYSVPSVVLYIYLYYSKQQQRYWLYEKKKKDDIRNYTQGWMIERGRNYYWKRFRCDKIYNYDIMEGVDDEKKYESNHKNLLVYIV